MFVTEGISRCWAPVLINFTSKFRIMVSRCVEQEGGEFDVNVEQHEQHADVTVLIVFPSQGDADEYTTVVRII